MADPLLEIRDLSVRIGREQILHRVGIQVARGSCHCIVGPNGAGKSTLLAAILGTLPFAGEIRLHWRSQRGIGFVPQRAPLDVSLPLTAQEFLALSRARRPVFWGLGFALRERVLALLKEAELEDIRHTPLAQLSGGELARLLFVNATDPLPELLLLDEPTSGLDAASRQRFEAEIRALRQVGLTVLMISHELQRVRHLADRVTWLDREVLHEGSADEVLARYLERGEGV